MAKNRRNKVYLPDLTRGLVSLASAGETVGYQISNHNIPDMWLQTEGEDITVAVLDTGCQLDHVDLQGSLITGFNFHDQNTSIIDGDGHGTHVSGIITANANAQGIVGVAPKCRVLVVQVLGSEGWGYVDSVASGVHFAIENGADIINMSLGSTEPDESLHEAIRRAYSNNIPVICAAGNSGAVGSLDYPGRYTESISIGALNAQNIRASFSQTGPNLDFMAPGVDILSTVPTNTYDVFSGTSMATPWTAGVVALMLAKHRKFGGSTPVNTVEEIKEHLVKTAVDLQGEGHDTATGYGLVSVKSMLESHEEEDILNMQISELIAKIQTWSEQYAVLEQEEVALRERLALIEASKTSFQGKADRINQILDEE